MTRKTKGNGKGRTDGKEKTVIVVNPRRDCEILTGFHGINSLRSGREGGREGVGEEKRRKVLKFNFTLSQMP